MGSVGPIELLVVLVFALLIFGPKKLPEIGRGVGSALREFKRHSRDLMSYLEEEPEPRRVYPETTPAIQPAESYPASLAEPYPEDLATTPTEDAKDEPAESATDTAEPAPVMPPSPTPSNTHPTT